MSSQTGTRIEAVVPQFSQSTLRLPNTNSVVKPFEKALIQDELMLPVQIILLFLKEASVEAAGLIPDQISSHWHT